VPKGFPTTSNLGQHLKKKHGITPSSIPNRTKERAHQMLGALYEEAKILDIDTTDIENVILANVIHKDVLMKALLQLITVRNLPFNCVTWPELHLLGSALNPQSSSAIPTAPATVVKALGETFIAQQDLIRKKLQAAITPIHIAVDI
jgi:hypothetical protein